MFLNKFQSNYSYINLNKRITVCSMLLIVIKIIFVKQKTPDCSANEMTHSQPSEEAKVSLFAWVMRHLGHKGMELTIVYPTLKCMSWCSLSFRSDCEDCVRIQKWNHISGESLKPLEIHCLNLLPLVVLPL